MDKKTISQWQSNALKTILSVVLIIIVLSAIINKPSAEVQSLPPQINIPDNEFMIGAMDAGSDNNYQYIPQLNMNAWHKYTAPENRGWPGVEYDDMNHNYTYYRNGINGWIINNRSHEMRSIFDRPKIQYLAMGQRSDYKCAELAGHYDEDYSFYTYANHNGNVSRDWQDITQFGDGQWVRYCRTANSTNQGSWINVEGDVVTGLKANHEQADKEWNYWQNDDTYKWYVMPRIRIPIGTPNNTLVCKIEILDWNGNPVEDYPNGKDIYAGNFKNLDNPYDGRYLEEFYPDPYGHEPPSAIEITAGKICPPPDKNFLNWNNSDIQTDYRVYWYGYCDMWIDYIRVENEPAYELFDEPPNIHDWSNQIREEVDLALTGKDNTDYVPNIFYIEEFEFNCLPCIGKVNQIIQDYASQQGVDLSLIPRCWCCHQQHIICGISFLN